MEGELDRWGVLVTLGFRTLTMSSLSPQFESVVACHSSTKNNGWIRMWVLF